MKLKHIITCIFLFISMHSHGQDTAILNSWHKLSDQFINRVQVSEQFAEFMSKTKFIDTVYIKNIQKSGLTIQENLGQAGTIDSSFVNDIQVLNSRLTGALSRLFAYTENDPTLRATKAFTDIQTSFMSAENRISAARKQYNEACKRLNREDLIYK